MRTVAVTATLTMALGLAGCLDELGTVDFNGTGAEFTLNESEKVNLDFNGIGSTLHIRSDVETASLNGSNNTVTIYQGVDIDTLEINGTNGQLTVQEGVTIGETEITGSDWSISVPASMNFSYSGSAIGLQVTTY